MLLKNSLHCVLQYHWQYILSCCYGSSEAVCCLDSEIFQPKPPEAFYMSSASFEQHFQKIKPDIRVIFKDYRMSTKRQKFCSVGLSKVWTNMSSAGWTVGSNWIREEKKRALKINFITARSLCPRSGFITWLVMKMPQLCLQLVCLSSHSSLRMLMRGSSTIHLNPRDQCEYLETDEQNGAD